MEIKKLRNTQTNICVRGSNSPKKLDFEMQRTLDFLNAQAIRCVFCSRMVWVIGTLKESGMWGFGECAECG